MNYDPRALDERLRLAAEAAGVGSWDLNPLTGELTWDERVRTVFGIAPDAPVTYDVFLARLHRDDRERVDALVRAALDPAGPGRYETEYRTVGEDGTERWVDARGRALFETVDGVRRATRFVGTTVDITTRKRSEERLREESELVETLHRIGGALASELDTDHIVQAVTDEATRLTGAQFGAFFYNLVDERGESYTLYTISGVPRETFSRFPMPRNTPVFQPTFHGTAIVRSDDITKDPRYGRNPPYHGMPKGHLPVVSYLAVPVISHDGSVLGGLFFGHERAGVFTERDERFIVGLAGWAAVAMDNARLYGESRRALDRAERSAGQIRRLQQATDALAEALVPEAVADVVVREGVAAVGARAGAVFLLDAERDVLLTLRAIGYPDGWVERWAEVPLGANVPAATAARTGEPQFIESEAEWTASYSPFGPLRLLESSRAWVALPLTAKGRTLGVLGLSFDREGAFGPEDRSVMLSFAQQCAQALERARLYEAERAARTEAERANKAKSDFLATMSHELRTPLNAIGGYAELMEMGVRGAVTEQQREDLGRIQRAQRHLLSLINDVLNFAKLEAGHVSFDLSDVPVREVIAGLEVLVAPQLSAKGLAYECLPCDPALAVRADAEKVRQILLNLLSNAIKFTDRGGRITVGAEPMRENVAISVRDTGRGIPSERLEDVFSPFVQIDRGLTSAHEGTGLGLAISRDLARAMGGDLKAASEPGTGSTFTLTLRRSLIAER